MKKQNTIRFITIVCTILFILILQSSIYVGVYAENSSVISESENYETWLQTVYSRDNGLPVGKANDLETTSDGLIWIGTYAGLYRYNGSKFQLMNRCDTVKSVECLYVDEEDRLWVGTNDQGISVFKNEELIGTLDTEQGLPSDTVRSIMKSSDGYYYIGTADSMAVVTFEKAPELVTTIPEIEYADKSTADQNGNVIAVSSYGTMYLLNHGEIVARMELAETDRYTSCEFDLSGYVHVGTSLGHVYVYEVTSDGFVEQSRLECRGIRKVNNLIRVNESTIFVCADNGIGYFDENDVFHSLKTPDFSSSIYNVILDYQGNLWFSSTRMGVLRLCKTSFVELFKEYSVAPVVVNSIERFEGKLYIGTDEGVVIIDEEKHQKITDDFTKRFEGIRIRQIFKDRRGHLWLGTYGEGAVEYDGKNFTYYNSDTSELGNRARTFLETSTGEILVSTENGIGFLRDGKVEKTLTENDGLKTQMNLCMLEKD
ncbi:MAG: two-component regulator propeller domain-containing protein, partial [Eubacteriales bacterium]|nr:two-component regulator propeller domain-containing protein [Eubacteriales bacterium]